MNVQSVPRGVEEVEALLESHALGLDQLGKDLDEATDAASQAEEAWTAHLDAVIENLEGLNEKMPGEDLRLSVARRTGEGRTLWFAHRRAERDIKRIEKRITQTANVISALQSKLRQAREEVKYA